MFNNYAQYKMVDNIYRYKIFNNDDVSFNIKCLIM